jgi:hypothetical protein
VSSLIASKKPSLEDSKDLEVGKEWAKEYLEGVQNEIYRVKLTGDIIQGLKFIELVHLVYKHCALIMFGADVILDNSEPIVCLNPYNYIFTNRDHTVYILADKMPDPNFINNQIKANLVNEDIEQNIEKALLFDLKVKNQTQKTDP